MFKVLVSLFACLTMWISVVSLAAEGDAAKPIQCELVWTEYHDGEHRILHSRLADENWSEPEIIYTTDKPVFTPALATDDKNIKTLVWSEQRQSKIVLMSSVER